MCKNGDQKRVYNDVHYLRKPKLRLTGVMERGCIQSALSSLALLSGLSVSNTPTRIVRQVF